MTDTRTKFSIRRRIALRSAVPLLVTPWACLPASAAASSFPDRPLRLLVPLPAGGVPDMAARLVSERLSPLLGQPVVVENRPGAAGLIATQQLMQAPADGHTLLYSDTTSWACAPAMKKQPGYDPVADLQPVTRTAGMKFFIFASTAFAIHSVQDLINLSKATPGGLSYATPGIGSIHHLSIERLRLATGAALVHVPFAGIAQSVTSVAAGDSAVMVSTMLPVAAQIKAGRVRAVAFGSATRSALSPDTPSLAEAGIKDIEIQIDQGIFVRAGTPEPMVARLNAALRQVMADATLQRKLSESGVDILSSSPQELSLLVKTDLQNYQRIVQRAQIARE